MSGAAQKPQKRKPSGFSWPQLKHVGTPLAYASTARRSTRRPTAAHRWTPRSTNRQTRNLLNPWVAVSGKSIKRTGACKTKATSVAVGCDRSSLQRMGLKPPDALAPAAAIKSGLSDPEGATRVVAYLLPVFHLDNAARVRDGYIRSSTRGHTRARPTRPEGSFCRRNVIASARSCPPVPPLNLHGKEGVDGSSPSEGSISVRKPCKSPSSVVWLETVDHLLG